MGQAQIDEDSQLDDGDQDEGQGEASLHQRDDEEDGGDGDGVDYLEVVIRRLDHVLHAGGLTDEHSALVILLQDGVQLIDLLIDIIGAK